VASAFEVADFEGRLFLAAGLSLIRCSGRQHYERLDDLFDPVFEQKQGGVKSGPITPG